MRRVAWRVAGAAALCAAAVAAEEEDGSGSGSADAHRVLTLEDDTFEAAIRAEVLLVEFYAPWCGHCKEIAPAYDLAAQQLGKIHGKQLLAKIDATNSASAVVKYKVHSYPTILLFSEGENVDELSGARSATDITVYMSKFARGPEEMIALKESIARTKAAEAGTGHLVLATPDMYNDFLLDHAEGTVVTFFHAKFCQECPAAMREFSAAADVLAEHGFPSRIMATMDTGAGGSRSPGPALFARPCADCPSCAGYPCIMVIDVDEEGESKGVLWPKALALSKDVFVAMLKGHLQTHGVKGDPKHSLPDSEAKAKAAALANPPHGGLSSLGGKTKGKYTPSTKAKEINAGKKKTGWPAIIVAAHNNQPKKVRAAIKAGDDVDASINLSAGVRDVTALHLAVRKNNPDMVKLLLEAGASPHGVAKPRESDGAVVGWSPLHDATGRGWCVECAELLLAAGASLRMEDKRGIVPASVKVNDVGKLWKSIVSSGTTEQLMKLDEAELRYRAGQAGVNPEQLASAEGSDTVVAFLQEAHDAEVAAMEAAEAAEVAEEERIAGMSEEERELWEALEAEKDEL